MSVAETPPNLHILLTTESEDVKKIGEAVNNLGKMYLDPGNNHSAENLTEYTSVLQTWLATQRIDSEARGVVGNELLTIDLLSRVMPESDINYRNEIDKTEEAIFLQHIESGVVDSIPAFKSIEYVTERVLSLLPTEHPAVSPVESTGTNYGVLTEKLNSAVGKNIAYQEEMSKRSSKSYQRD